MDASAWIAVGAAAIALLAAVAAALEARHAKRQADAAERQTELQERMHRDAHQPYVWADFRADLTQGSLLRLVVRNEGPTVAEDVRIVFEPPLRGIGVRRDFGPVQARLSEGIVSMPPGREMMWNFAMGPDLFSENADVDVPLQYTVTITGRGPFGGMPTLTYTLDLEDIRETAAPRLGTLDQVTKAIEKLAKQVSAQP